MLTKEETVDAINIMSSRQGQILLSAYAKRMAIDFHNWQKKDQSECCADMSTEDYFEKYILLNQSNENSIRGI